MWIDAHLDSIKKETESTWRFFIKISDKNFSLIAGQFIQVKIDDIVRSYSVASLIDNKNVIELIIVKLDGGKMTNYLFNKIINLNMFTQNKMYINFFSDIIILA